MPPGFAAILPPNLQCHFNVARAWLVGPSTKTRSGKATMMYRIANNLVETPAGQYLIATGAATRGHHQQFLSIYCSINAYKGSFFPSTARLWHGLPTNVISVSTLEDFRYPKTLIVNNMFLTAHKNLPARMF